MGTIVTSLFVFVLVTLFFVGALISARRFLLPHSDVPIVINDDSSRTIFAALGSSLLSTLANKGIFVPSGCGGRGTCGACGVTIREGGGELLPTERGFITRGEARRGRHLACQVKVRRPMRVEVPSEALSVGRWRCRVLANRNVSTFIKELKLALPDGVEVPFRAGGYVQIQCPPHEISFRDFAIDAPHSAEWDRFDLRRFKSVVTEPVERAYSMANFPLEKGVLLFTIRIAFPPNYDDAIPPGKVSSWLFSLKPGDEVTVSGPYGEFFARETQNEMCFVAAGAGMAPMRSHILDQLLRLRTKRKITFWYSARNLGEAFYVDEFDRLQAEHPNFEWHLVLSEPRPEDRWTGPVGLVRHNVLRDRYLANHAAPEDIEYYLCGPDVMNKAVIKTLTELGVDRDHILLDDFG